MKDIPTPSVNELKRYLDKWNNTEEYVLHDETLKKLVSLFPNNLDKQGVLVKATCINSFYNTRIFKMIPVSKHILDLKIDERLKSGDITLVNELAKVIYEIEGKVIEKNFYSFTTKYCCIHRNDIYPIYDKYVDKILMYFKNKDKFCNFKKDDLKDYNKYVDVINAFRKNYGLEDYDYRTLDKYLWQLGKEYFD